MLKGGDTGRRCREVMSAELKADDITREVMVAIRTSFITPFDRADIKNLITSMDDAIDQMQQTAKAILLFEMTSFEPEMQGMADAMAATTRRRRWALSPGCCTPKGILAANSTCRCGSFSRARRPWRSEHIWEDGALSAQWARASPASIRCKASAPRWVAQ